MPTMPIDGDGDSLTLDLAPTVAALVGGGARGAAVCGSCVSTEGQTSSQVHATWNIHVEAELYALRHPMHPHYRSSSSSPQNNNWCSIECKYKVQMYMVF